MKFFIIAIMVLFFALSLLMTGCATSSLYDGEGKLVYRIESYGFFRDGEGDVTKPDGTHIRVSSKSTTSDILRAGNEILGTAAGIIGKVP